MKRALSIFLMLLMLVSLVSCTIGSDDGSDTNTNTETNTSANTNTSTSTGTNTNTPPAYVPDYTKDTANYSPRTNTAKTAIYYLNETLEYPTVTKYKNGAKAALSMTFDDANNPNAGIIVSEVFEKYGMRGTVMATVSFMKESAGSEEQSIQAWRNVFDLGYLDLGCHGYDHVNPETLAQSDYYKEIGSAIEYLRTKFPEQRVITYATPLARITNSYEEYLKDYVIANRLEAAGGFAVIGENFNMYRIKSTMVQNGTNLRPVYESIQSSVDAERWIVTLFHDIIEDNQSSGWNPTYRSTFEGYCRHLYETYGDTVWFGSFEEVAIYASQYEHITIEYSAASRESMTLSVDCDLDSEIYNTPVGIRVQLPRFIDSAVAFVNGVPQQLELDKSTKNKVYAVVKDVTIYDTEVEIVFGNNTTFRNGCGVHNFELDSEVEATPTTLGYTLYRCLKCECTHKKQVYMYVENNGSENEQDPDQDNPAGDETTTE